MLGDDHAYDTDLDAISESLRDAIAAAKAKAEEFRARIEKVVNDSDRLISSLETHEQQADEAANK